MLAVVHSPLPPTLREINTTLDWRHFWELATIDGKLAIEPDAEFALGPSDGAPTSGND
jgi:hypothetical protein